MPAPHDEVDIYRPFIAQDGLEYGGLAAFILGQPLDTWRNQRIQEHRKAGRSEASIREWIKGYDGDDPRTTPELEIAEKVRRQVAANFAVHPLGLPDLADRKTRARRAWWGVSDFDDVCSLCPPAIF